MIPRHVWVAMSSGVDSSLCAALLKKSYDKVTGIFMSNWSGRCSDRNWDSVQRTADHIGIEVKRVDFEHQYWSEVFEKMVQGYSDGNTPNPDVLCNKSVKFGALFQYIQQKSPGAFLATGHYAQVRDRQLYRPKDLQKDQTYYLSSIHRSVLSRLLFPLHSLMKSEVREQALQLGLPSAQQAESQGLCFIEQSEKSFDRFLAEYLPDTPGDILDPQGRVVGSHRGLWQMTIGQRSRITMPQGDPQYAGRWYIGSKDLKNNTMTIARGDDPILYTDCLSTSGFNWLGDIDGSENLFAQIRHQQDPISVSVDKQGEGVHVKFARSVRGVVCAQHLVLWQNERCLGGGPIDRAWHEKRAQ